ncbi:unnamed protein product [Natator depressus]
MGGPAAGPAESGERLQESNVEGNGHLETGGEPGRIRSRDGELRREDPLLHPCPNCRKCNYKTCTIVLAVALATMFLVLIIVLAEFPIGGAGDCAYLNGLSAVSSLRCTSERHWICTKPDAFTQGQESAVEGGW